MKYLKKFNESIETPKGTMRNRDIPEYEYFDRVYSDKLKQTLIKNGISGGNGWEDGAVRYSTRTWTPTSIIWGESVESLENMLGLKHPTKDTFAQIVRIFEDRIGFNMQEINYVCVIWDPECDNDCVAFFVEDVMFKTYKEIVCEDGLEYQIFDLEIKK